MVFFDIEWGSSSAGNGLGLLGVLLFKGLGLLFVSSVLDDDFKWPNITIFGVNFGRRRRDAAAAGGGMNEPIDLTGLLSLMDILDPDHCLPMALCTSAAVDPTNRTSEETALLNSIGFTGIIDPPSIPELTSHSGHIRYAVLVGHLMHNPDLCPSLVPECPLTPEQAITLLTMDNTKCQQMALQDHDHRNTLENNN